MHTIKVFTKKVPLSKTSFDEFTIFSNELTIQANKAPGFIYSKSYWKYNACESPLTLYTMSKWKTHAEWKNWEKSKERQKVHVNKYII